MARPRSEEKRRGIIDAAVRVFAERGLGAPTAAISQAAGVAEGTLFTYFANKDELVNAVYREIKQGLGGELAAGFPRQASLRRRLRHVWEAYVCWGVEHAAEHAVMKQIMVWGGLTEESKAAGMAAFAAVGELWTDARGQGMCTDLSQDYAGAAMAALAETAIEFSRMDPAGAEGYRKAGFAMLWAGVARKR